MSNAPQNQNTPVQKDQYSNKNDAGKVDTSKDKAAQGNMKNEGGNCSTSDQSSKPAIKSSNA